MNILVFTGTRAEYGILRPLIKELQIAKNICVSILVTGTHMSKEFGYTIEEIYADNWGVKLHCVETVLSSDTPTSVCKAMGLGLISYSEILSSTKPDLMLCLGDRFETLAAVTAAVTCNVPVAHLQGGEVTRGALDDLYRHAITKMSSLHFTATEIYKRRVLQMGESPDRVFNVGALNVEAMKHQENASRNDFFAKFSIPDGCATAIVTLHPSTLEPGSAETHFEELMTAFKMRPEIIYIVTKTISDADGRTINNLWDKSAQIMPNLRLSSSLGHYWYKAALTHCNLCIGNSSSGIIETSHFNIPTVNIGVREEGRVQGANVVNCEFDAEEIVLAIDKGLSVGFINSVRENEDPYDGGETSKRIVDHMRACLPIKSMKKNFHETSFPN